MARKTYQTNYSVAVNWFGNSLILCNDIERIDPTVYENAHFNWEDEDGDQRDIFQWFLTDLDEERVRYMEQMFPDLLFTYSELLDLYVLCVDHCGTAWAYVVTRTTNPNAVRKEGEKR